MIDNQTNNFTTKLERLKHVMFHLRINDGIELAKALNYSQGYISEILNEKKGIPKTMGQRLEDKLAVNRKWFDNGNAEGGMFFPNGQTNTHEVDNIGSVKEPVTVYKKTEKSIPVYVNPGTAGDVEVYNDIPADEPAFYVNIPQFKDCKFGKSIFGHSMYPTITSGAYIFCKEVPEKTRYIPGEIYYIEYDNFGVCKRVQKGPSPDEVLLVSDNDELRNDGTRRYESYVIKIDHIREMFLVKGFFNQNHN